jgi:hypothetical protein
VSPVIYELDFYIPEDAILHSHHHENLKYRNIEIPWFNYLEIQTSDARNMLVMKVFQHVPSQIFSSYTQYVHRNACKC